MFSYLRRYSHIAFIAITCLMHSSSAASAAPKQKKKQDLNDNRGNTPFYLQDPYDEMCLGPHGFTACNEQALWVLTRRPGKKTYSIVSLLNPSPYGMCLERKSRFFGLFKSSKVSIGPCDKSGAKNWEFEFIDSKHVKLSTQGQCLVRGKGGYRSSMTVQSCKKGEYLPLVYHPTAYHETGFFLRTADARCLDGSKFISCSGTAAKQLLWGVGIKYSWGKANRYFFNMADDTKCLVSKGSHLEKGDCSSGNAMKWGIIDGQMSQGNGKVCVARLQDNTAALAKCNEASEYMALEVPQTYSAEDLAELLQNQDKLSTEERAALQQLLRQQQAAGSY